MNLLLSIPDALGSKILAVWVTVLDVFRLDRAFLSHLSRQHYLALLSSCRTLGELHHGCESELHLGYYQWLAKRSLTVLTVTLPTQSSKEVADKLRGFVSTCSLSLRRINFRSLLCTEGPVCNMVDLFLPHARNLRSLTIGTYKYTEQYFWDLAQFSPQLCFLSVSNGFIETSFGQVEGAISFPALRTLLMEGFILQPRFFRKLANATDKLEELDLANCMFENPLTPPLSHTWTRLRKLVVSYHMSEDVIVDILRANHQLMVLVILSSVRPISDITLHCIAEHCRELLELTVQSQNTTDEGMCAVLQNCPWLEELNIKNSNYSSATYLAVAQYGGNLAIIDIEYCNVENSDLLAIVNGCTQLRQFYFSIDAMDRTYLPLFSLLVQREIEVCDEYVLQGVYVDTDGETDSAHTPTQDFDDDDDDGFLSTSASFGDSARSFS